MVGQSRPVSGVWLGLSAGNAMRVSLRSHRGDGVRTVRHDRLASLQKLVSAAALLLHRRLHGHLQVCFLPFGREVSGTSILPYIESSMQVTAARDTTRAPPPKLTVGGVDIRIRILLPHAPESQG